MLVSSHVNRGLDWKSGFDGAYNWVKRIKEVNISSATMNQYLYKYVVHLMRNQTFKQEDCERINQVYGIKS